MSHLLRKKGKRHGLPGAALQRVEGGGLPDGQREGDYSGFLEKRVGGAPVAGWGSVKKARWRICFVSRGHR